MLLKKIDVIVSLLISVQYRYTIYISAYIGDAIYISVTNSTDIGSLANLYFLNVFEV